MITELEARTCKLCGMVVDTNTLFVSHLRHEHNKMTKQEYVVSAYYAGKIPTCKCGCGKELSFRGLVRGPWYKEYALNHEPQTPHSQATKDKISDTLKQKERPPQEMHTCKMCTELTKITRKYCSNACKFADPEYNESRVKSLRKIRTYQWNCPKCDWGTDNIDNKSGSLTIHLTAVHNWSKERVYEEYPHLEQDVRHIKQLERNQSELECQICGDKLGKITATHLAQHGITIAEYKEKYKCDNTANLATQIKQRAASLAKQVANIFDGNRLPSTIVPMFTKENYTGVTENKKYPFQCTVCTNVFEDDIDNGCMPICRNCNPKLECSPNGAAQDAIYQFLRANYDGPVLTNDRNILSPKEVDMYLPELKLGVEYHGLYWHNERFTPRDTHRKKWEMAEKAGIRLIQIFEDEWINHPDVIKSKLMQLLGKTSVVIAARKTIAKVVDSDQANLFLAETHLQGSGGSSVKVGLFDSNDVLVALMTFGKPRVSLGQKAHLPNTMELMRLSFALNTTVTGGVSKLLSFFKKTYPNITTVYSYADLRYVSRAKNVYKSTGFIELSVTRPNYWYFKKGSLKRQHRFAFTKQKLLALHGLIESEKTEYELADELGYLRIWDCGNLKYELDCTK